MLGAVTVRTQAATFCIRVTHTREKGGSGLVFYTWEKGGSGLVFYTDDVFWEVCKLPSK